MSINLFSSSFVNFTIFPHLDVQANLGGREHRPLGAPLSDRVLEQRQRAHRANSQHRLASSDQKELQQKPSRVLHGRVWWRNVGRFQGSAEKLYAVVCCVFTHLIFAASERPVTQWYFADLKKICWLSFNISDTMEIFCCTRTVIWFTSILVLFWAFHQRIWVSYLSIENELFWQWFILQRIVLIWGRF